VLKIALVIRCRRIPTALVRRLPTRETRERIDRRRSARGTRPTYHERIVRRPVPRSGPGKKFEHNSQFVTTPPAPVTSPDRIPEIPVAGPMWQIEPDQRAGPEARGPHERRPGQRHACQLLPRTARSAPACYLVDLPGYGICPRRRSRGAEFNRLARLLHAASEKEIAVISWWIRATPD